MVSIFAVIFVLFLTGCNSPAPDHLGVRQNLFAPCPQYRWNCVSSFAHNKKQWIRPFPYAGKPVEDFKRDLKMAILGMGGKVILEKDDYLHAEFTTTWLGLLSFVDDVEVYFPRDKEEAYLKSKARVGIYDFGANRTRLEKIRFDLYQSGT